MCLKILASTACNLILIRENRIKNENSLRNKQKLFVMSSIWTFKNNCKARSISLAYFKRFQKCKCNIESINLSFMQFEIYELNHHRLRSTAAC